MSEFIPPRAVVKTNRRAISGKGIRVAQRRIGFRRLLLGDPLSTAQAHGERISKVKALAVFSSDALSSVAYATEEIIYVLILAGSAGMSTLLPISLAIVGLLLIVGTSYYQTIHAYPGGGGAYIVASENLGVLPGLTAGGALMIGYVLTVTVSIAAGIGAAYSAIPALYPFRVEIGVLIVFLIMLINLRGIRESASVFALPTYLFMISIWGLLAIGLFFAIRGNLGIVHQLPEGAGLVPVQGLTLFLLLRAFSAGCTALTGVEAISNGIPAFKPPEAKNAGITLMAMIAILSTMFLGISLLASRVGVVPGEGETVLSQIARGVLGEGPGYGIIQGATVLILILAANTAFADFPRLSSLIARDGYLPRQLYNLGDRLVFSNGIVLLAAVASLLLVIFRGDTHALLPLYAAGVFLSFALSQSGMVVHWWRLRTPGWQRSIVINAIGALSTGVVTIVVTVTRFTQGAWIVVLLIPITVLIFKKIKSHYANVAAQLSLDRFGAPPMIRRHRVIVPIGGLHRGVLHALHYGRSLSPDVTAVYVDSNAEETANFRKKWEQWGDGIRLELLPSPYRSIIGPLMTYLDALDERRQPQDMTTVVLPNFIVAHWWENLLHNQNALLLRLALVFRRGTVVTEVPYRLRH